MYCSSFVPKLNASAEQGTAAFHGNGSDQARPSFAGKIGAEFISKPSGSIYPGIMVRLRLGLRPCTDDLAKRKLVGDVLHGVAKLCEMLARLRGLLNIFSRLGGESRDLLNIGVDLHR